MQHSPRQGLSRQSARSSRPQSARVSARPSSARPTEENRQPYVLSINCPPEELPNYGLKYTAPYPVQPGRPSSARSSRISSPRATVRAQASLLHKQHKHKTARQKTPRTRQKEAYHVHFARGTWAAHTHRTRTQSSMQAASLYLGVRILAGAAGCKSEKHCATTREKQQPLKVGKTKRNS